MSACGNIYKVDFIVLVTGGYGMFTLFLNVYSLLALSFAAGSFFVLVHLAVNVGFQEKIRKVIFWFSLVLLILSASFEIIFLSAEPLYAYDVDPVWNGSIWLSIASNVLGLLLIYASNNEESGRHAESTNFDLIVYGMCVAATTFIIYCTCYFGDDAEVVYFLANVVTDIITLTYAYMVWRYVRIVVGDNSRSMQLSSQIYLMITIFMTALFLSSPWTGLFVSDSIVDQMGIEMQPAILIGYSPAILIGIGILVVAARSSITTSEKISFYILVAVVPVAIAIRALIPNLFINVMVNLVALAFCHFGISSRRALDYRRHQTQLDMATTIQQGMLPQKFPDDARFRIAAHMWPAREVAGDFYDFYQVDDDHFYITVADVSGKDVPAAMFMARAHALIREYESQDLAPHEIFNRVNAALAEGNSQKLFVTAWMGKVNLRLGLMTYANAGHNPPIMVTHNDDSVDYLRTKVNLILGIRKKTKYARQTLLLHPGDRIMLYTDGVTESINVSQEQYGEDRLIAFTKTTLDKTGAETVQGVYDDVNSFASDMEQFDDITVLCASYRNENCDVKDMVEGFFPPNLEQLYDVINFLDENCLRMGYPEDELNKLEVCSEEVFADIAKFAYGSVPTKGDEVRVSVIRTTEALSIQFSDKGSPFNPLLTLGSSFIERARSRDNSRLGIILVNELMDEVSYQFDDGENRLTMVKKLPGGLETGGDLR